jgi:hypothetical protein
VGGLGADRMLGGAGDDNLDGVDGAPHDSLRGGGGLNVCLADPGDARRACR